MLKQINERYEFLTLKLKRKYFNLILLIKEYTLVAKYSINVLKYDKNPSFLDSEHFYSSIATVNSPE